MAIVCNPYLSFDGSAREAMTAYQRIFGGELFTSTHGEFGNTGPQADRIMHASLMGTVVLMASDAVEGMGPVPSNGQISLSGEDESTLRGYFEALSEGGTVTLPLDKQVWGDVFGMVTDKFGVAWMVNITSA